MLSTMNLFPKTRNLKLIKSVTNNQWDVLETGSKIENHGPFSNEANEKAYINLPVVVGMCF